MKERGNNYLTVGAELALGAGLLMFLSQFAFTRKERNWIVDRDDGTSQMRHYSEEKGFCADKVEDCQDCNGQGCGNQVHHITPQRWAREHLGWSDDQIDSPENGITLYQCEHTGRVGKGKYMNPDESFIVHDDMPEAFQNYGATHGQSFSDMFAERGRKCEEGEPYWNTDHDDEMKETAKQRTDNYVMEGHTWPKRRAKK